MSTPRSASSGGSPLPFCERCGNLIGPAATLAGIRLSMCPSCGVHACDRCWSRAGSACPGCGVSLAGAPTGGISLAGAMAGGVAQQRGLATSRWRTARPAVIAGAAIAAVVVAVSAVAFSIGNPFRPTGEVEGAVGTPATVASASPGPAQSDGVAVLPSGSPAAVSAAPTAAPPIPSETPALPSGIATPTPGPTPGPTPAPTPGPTPAPTPAPAPSSSRSRWSP